MVFIKSGMKGYRRGLQPQGARSGAYFEDFLLLTCTVTPSVVTAFPGTSYPQQASSLLMSIKSSLCHTFCPPSRLKRFLYVATVCGDTDVVSNQLRTVLK